MKTRSFKRNSRRRTRKMQKSGKRYGGKGILGDINAAFKRNIYSGTHKPRR